MDDEEVYRRVQERKRGVGLAPAEHQWTRREEVNALLKLIDGYLSLTNPEVKNIKPDEPAFIASIEARMRDQRYEPSEKEVFWLRDIKDRLI